MRGTESRNRMCATQLGARHSMALRNKSRFNLPKIVRWGVDSFARQFGLLTRCLSRSNSSACKKMEGNGGVACSAMWKQLEAYKTSTNLFVPTRAFRSSRETIKWGTSARYGHTTHEFARVCLVASLAALPCLVHLGNVCKPPL